MPGASVHSGSTGSGGTWLNKLASVEAIVVEATIDV
jgi:hypothetical protein